MSKASRWSDMPLVLGSVLMPFVLVLAACNWVPSGLRLGGTPLTKLEAAQKTAATVSDSVVAAAQSSVHQADLALRSAPDSRSVVVARDFISEAQALLDQSQGAPTAGEIAKWEKLVAGLISDNEAVRAAAERDREDGKQAVAKISARLSDANVKTEQWRVKAMAFAADADSKADFIRKIVFYGSCLAVLWIVAQLVRIGANFVPALAPASAVLNSVVAPAVQYAAHRAQTGLQLVGQAIGTIRNKAPEIAERVTEFIDDKVEDPALRRTISTAAKTVTAPTEPAFFSSL